MRSRIAVGTMALALLLGACGSDDESSGDSSPASSPVDDTTADEESATGNEPAESDGGGDDPQQDAEEFVDEIADDLEEQQEASGGGEATLVVGDQTWTFSPVLCAFGEEQIGQEGAEFVLSSLQDGMQMYASIDSFGHLVSLDDIEDFENPRVSLSSFGDVVITVDGKRISAEAEFADGTSESGATVAGSFTATCP